MISLEEFLVASFNGLIDFDEFSTQGEAKVEKLVDLMCLS
jgi:hypothetical protein